MKVVIVGGVAGGATAAARIRRLDEQAEIVVFERSGYISYANCGLPYYIGGVIEDAGELTLQTPESFFARFRVQMKVLHEVTAIHPDRKTVSVTNLQTGECFEESYDKGRMRVSERRLRINRIEPTLPMKKRMRVAAYARVSTEKGAMQHSLAAQISYYSELIQSNPEYEYAGVYADEGLSRTLEGRPEFQRMLQDCREGKIDRILCKSISRFARNTVMLLKTVRELKQLGVSVYFEEQNIDTMSGDGELMLTVLASFAQEESRSVSENCKWRIRKKLEQGIPTGLRMYGYKVKTAYSPSYQRRRRSFGASSACIWRGWAANES